MNKNQPRAMLIYTVAAQVMKRADCDRKTAITVVLETEQLLPRYTQSTIAIVDWLMDWEDAAVNAAMMPRA